MSQRERWIIYPLLFFCFAMCIKLYWYPPPRNIKAKSIVCESLSLQDETKRPFVTAGGRPNGDGYLLVHAAPMEGAPGRAPLKAVSLEVLPNRRGVVAAYSEIGQPLVKLIGDNRGGNVVLFDASGRPVLVTHVPRLTGTPPADPNDPRAAPVRPPVPPAASNVSPAPTTVGSDAT